MSYESLESLECLLAISDDKGRVVIPSNIRKPLDIVSGSFVELTYLKVENRNEQAQLLPLKESNHLDTQGRFQTSSNTRKYLGLKKGAYFVAVVKKYV
ncbi:MAG: hypothetical protein KJ583_05285 [Nanoarchaeota archaeon]|nr:hypothetical protein [Nanoarchaeota archaeon]MBU1269565.1 hypothetical protein [Nanoarchaeota archaeon]MBU1604703.1 hypothetical protein [Nanoarchaeota archaeon]MBU2443826.1 hypothetical protein [Nanoarchaeota archaeon]